MSFFAYFSGLILTSSVRNKWVIWERACVFCTEFCWQTLKSELKIKHISLVSPKVAIHFTFHNFIFVILGKAVHASTVFGYWWGGSDTYNTNYDFRIENFYYFELQSVMLVVPSFLNYVYRYVSAINYYMQCHFVYCFQYKSCQKKLWK